ncbi:hypothetical protein HCDSEM_116 [Candidatus Hodgkinia cicadicola Dsem]|nr:hypothetical protein HCDSEM_116 [Candidatus Hodgkinia cicadicola Dsem]
MARAQPLPLFRSKEKGARGASRACYSSTFAMFSLSTAISASQHHLQPLCSG